MAVNKKKCTCCKQDKYEERYFWKSYSNIYLDNGRLPVCKDCFKEMFNKLNEKYNSSIKALKHLCFNFDIYFDDNLAEESMRKKCEDSIDEYMKIVNRNSKYRGKTSFDNSIEDKLDIEIELKEIKINNDMVERWGAGLRKEDYMFLENKFNEFSIAYQCKRPAEKMLLEQISKCLLKSDEALRNGDATGFEKMNTLISKLMNDANIKPIQEASLAENETITWGTWIDKIENYRPIGEPSEQFKDVDKIKTYINKWFIGQMRKVFDLASEDNPNDDQD